MPFVDLLRNNLHWPMYLICWFPSKYCCFFGTFQRGGLLEDIFYLDMGFETHSTLSFQCFCSPYCALKTFSASLLYLPPLHAMLRSLCEYELYSTRTAKPNKFKLLLVNIFTLYHIQDKQICSNLTMCLTQV